MSKYEKARILSWILTGSELDLQSLAFIKVLSKDTQVKL